jgi:hypothetical protein
MENGWKKVYSTDKEYKTVILREKLAEAEIESSQISKKGSGIEPFFGYIEIYVLEKDFDKAYEIITKHSDL